MHTQGMEMLSDFAKGGGASKDCKFERLFFFFFLLESTICPGVVRPHSNASGSQSAVCFVIIFLVKLFGKEINPTLI